MRQLRLDQPLDTHVSGLFFTHFNAGSNLAQHQSNFVHSLLRARDWQDRPQLDAVCRWWADGGTGVCALIGIGGAGKTAVADRFLQMLPDVLPPHPDVPKRTDLRVFRQGFTARLNRAGEIQRLPQYSDRDSETLRRRNAVGRTKR